MAGDDEWPGIAMLIEECGEDAGDLALSSDDPPQPASEITATIVNAAVRYAFGCMV
jgi:hypothetical protein